MSWLDTRIARGFSAWIVSQPMPMSSIVPVALFSMITSVCAISCFSAARPSGFFTLTPKLCLLRDDDAKDGEVHAPVTVRMKSG